MDDLALEVGVLDLVVVDDGDRPDSGSCEGEDHRRAEASCADDGDVGGRESPLPLVAEAREDGVPRGALALAIRQGPGGGDKRRDGHGIRLDARGGNPGGREARRHTHP
ncbi:acyl-CoA synthetase (AMP-forming)/AMP-acidligase II [Microbacterium sp. TS-1]|nr:acyl-CoA synthetase (AMP-forming)/AMP-acidligase II [Microbacterium sp. TS-1]